MANGNDRQRRLIDLLSGGGLMEDDLAGPIELTDALREDVNVQTVPGSNADILTGIGTDEGTTRSLAQQGQNQQASGPTGSGAGLSGRRIIDALRERGTVEPDMDTPFTPGQAANPEEVGEAASALSGLQKFLENPANQELLAQFGMSFAPQDEGLQQLGQATVQRAQAEQMQTFQDRLEQGMSLEEAAQGLNLTPEMQQRAIQNVQQQQRLDLEERRVEQAGERIDLEEEALNLREEIQRGQLSLDEAALQLQRLTGNRDFSVDRARLLLESERLDIMRRNAQLRFAEMMQDATEGEDLQLGMFDRVQARVGREFLDEAKRQYARRIRPNMSDEEIEEFVNSQEVINFFQDPQTGSINYDRVFNQLGTDTRSQWRQMTAEMAEQIRGGAGLEAVTQQMFGEGGDNQTNIQTFTNPQEAREATSPGDRFRFNGVIYERLDPAENDGREIRPVQ